MSGSCQSRMRPTEYSLRLPAIRLFPLPDFGSSDFPVGIVARCGVRRGSWPPGRSGSGGAGLFGVENHGSGASLLFGAVEGGVGAAQGGGEVLAWFDESKSDADAQ